MTGRPRYTVAQVIQALDDTKGMVYLAARRLGCSHTTVYNYARRHPTVQLAIDANRGVMLDTAEVALWKGIQDGESWAVQFALRTIGRNRGYVERKEVAGPDGGPLEIGIKEVLVEIPDETTVDSGGRETETGAPQGAG